MASLFDIAAELSQYDSLQQRGQRSQNNNNQDAISNESYSSEALDTKKPPHERSQPPLQRQSTLSILDEVLQTMYAPSSAITTNNSNSTTIVKPPQIWKSNSVSSLRLLSESMNTKALDERMQQLRAQHKPTDHLATSSSATKLRNVYNHSISYQDLNNVQTSLVSTQHPPDNQHQPQQQPATAANPDVVAKRLLREITDEVEQLLVVSKNANFDGRATVRMLMEKYLDAQLNKLPGTLFVQLARKKTLLKIQQLEEHFKPTPVSSSPPQHIKEFNQSMNKPSNEPNQHDGESFSSIVTTTKSTDPMWQRLQALTSEQHQMLQNLLKIPKEQLLKLPKSQLEVVKFAKRYDKFMNLTAAEMRSLPPQHQAILISMQRQAASVKQKTPSLLSATTTTNTLHTG